MGGKVIETLGSAGMSPHQSWLYLQPMWKRLKFWKLGEITWDISRQGGLLIETLGSAGQSPGKSGYMFATMHSGRTLDWKSQSTWDTSHQLIETLVSAGMAPESRLWLSSLEQMNTEQIPAVLFFVSDCCFWWWWRWLLSGWEICRLLIGRFTQSLRAQCPAAKLQPSSATGLHQTGALDYLKTKLQPSGLFEDELDYLKTKWTVTNSVFV